MLSHFVVLLLQKLEEKDALLCGMSYYSVIHASQFLFVPKLRR